MDIVIEKKKQFGHKKLVIAAGLIAAAIYLGQYIWQISSANFTVSRSTVSLGEAKQGNFTVSVRGAGKLVADQVQWISTRTEAKVETQLVKAGDVVKKGDLLAKLSNIQLERQLEEEKWELEALMEENHATRIQLENTLLEYEALVLNNKLDYEKSVVIYEAYHQLIDSRTVSNLDYQSRRFEMHQAKERWLVSQKQLVKMRENVLAQQKSREVRTKQSQNRVQRIQQQIDDLDVRATIDAIVQEIPIKPGQQLMLGGNVARLAAQDNLIAELQIPEIQIRNVKLGQSVIIDTRNNKVSGVVARIEPAVVNGNVKVGVEFKDKLPADARPDLSVDGEIKIADLSNTLYIERPLFAQTDSVGTVYKLSDDGQTAERAQIRFGKGSMSHIQIEEGLAKGDRIIVSDPSRFEGFEVIRLN